MSVEALFASNDLHVYNMYYWVNCMCVCVCMYIQETIIVLLALNTIIMNQEHIKELILLLFISCTYSTTYQKWRMVFVFPRVFVFSPNHSRA